MPALLVKLHFQAIVVSVLRYDNLTMSKRMQLKINNNHSLKQPGVIQKEQHDDWNIGKHKVSFLKQKSDKNIMKE